MDTLLSVAGRKGDGRLRAVIAAGCMTQRYGGDVAEAIVTQVQIPSTRINNQRVFKIVLKGNWDVHELLAYDFEQIGR